MYKTHVQIFARDSSHVNPLFFFLQALNGIKKNKKKVFHVSYYVKASDCKFILTTNVT